MRSCRPDALLFDCDGVLVDTEPDGHRVAFNEAFKQKGMAGSQESCTRILYSLRRQLGRQACVQGARSGISWASHPCVPMHAHAGIKHEWDLELYGRLLETGGGKERMTAYFTVSRH